MTSAFLKSRLKAFVSFSILPSWWIISVTAAILEEERSVRQFGSEASLRSSNTAEHQSLGQKKAQNRLTAADELPYVRELERKLIKALTSLQLCGFPSKLQEETSKMGVTRCIFLGNRNRQLWDQKKIANQQTVRVV